MNTDPSGLETSEQMIVWGDDYSAQNLVGQARAYRCAFCKRGFSNAQALGGHMNIHRKDRAKLKEFSGENLLSLDIKKSTDYEHDSPPADCNSAAGEKLSLGDQNQTKRQCSDDDDQDLHDEGNRDYDHDIIQPVVKENLISRRLALFSEAPDGRRPFDKHVDGREVELNYGELDLELRLGPEPHDHAKSKP